MHNHFETTNGGNVVFIERIKSKAEVLSLLCDKVADSIEEVAHRKFAHAVVQVGELTPTRPYWGCGRFCILLEVPSSVFGTVSFLHPTSFPYTYFTHFSR